MWHGDKMQNNVIKFTFAVITVAVLSAQAVAANSSAVQWLDDPEVAAREATRTGKPILMQVTASWCGYCHKMFRETYVDPAIVQTANTDFVCLKVDADKYKKLVDGIGIKALPTTVILTPSLRVSRKLSGYQTVSRLGGALRESKRLAKRSGGTTQLAQQTPRPQAPGVATAQVTPPRNRQQLPATRSMPNTRPRTSAENGNPFEQLGPSTRTAAKPPVRTVSQPKIFPDGFDRMCLVTLFDDRRVEVGSMQFSSPYRSRTVYFSSADAKARFDANPERYWPVLDGYCVVTYLEHNQRVQGNPVSGAVFRGRMWFFNSSTQMEAFIANPKEYLPQRRTLAI